MLTEAVKERADRVWILAVRERYQWVALFHVEGRWFEHLSQTWLWLPDLIEAFRQRAGSTGIIDFEHAGARYAVRFRALEGEHQTEAQLDIERV